MGTRRKLLSIIEAAYEPAAGFDAWIRHVCDAFTGTFPGPIPAFALVHHPRDHRMEVETVHANENAAALLEMVREMSAKATPDEVKRLWGRRAGVGTVSEQLGGRRLPRSPGWLVASKSDHHAEDSVGLFFERDDGRTVTLNAATGASAT